METSFSLKGKNIIVTGGTGVLGRNFSRGISNAGANVIVIGRDPKKAEELFKGFSNIHFYTSDVLDESSLQMTGKKIFADFNEIHGLVNSAGGNVKSAVIENDADLFSMDAEGLKDALFLNTMGTILPIKVFGKKMAEYSGGSIVNISSVSAKRPLTKVLGYGMGKAALDNYTQWMAIELAKRYGENIRINSISPGFFLSEQNRHLLTQPDGHLTPRGQKIIGHTPFKRFGQPEELVSALIWLLSDSSKFVTGSDIIIDGGFTKYSGV